MEQRLVPRLPVRLALLLVCLLASACGSQQASRSYESVEPRFQRAFLGLERALDSDENRSARRILSGILARKPEGKSLGLAEAYGRVLDGRALGEQLEFVLEGELIEAPESEGGSALYRMVLYCTNHSQSAVQLLLPPPTVERLDHRLYLSGSDSRAVENRVIDGLEGLSLEAEESFRIDLGEFDASLANAIARRDRWRLEALSGEVVANGERLPLRAPEVASYERVFLAPYLPDDPVEPEILLEYIERQSFTMPGLLERCIRIDPARWSETLRRLVPLVRSMDDERLAYIAPALRWLSRSARLGGDPRTWRMALSNLEEEPSARSALDLPERDSDAEVTQNAPR